MYVFTKFQSEALHITYIVYKMSSHQFEDDLVCSNALFSVCSSIEYPSFVVQIGVQFDRKFWSNLKSQKVTENYITVIIFKLDELKVIL